MSRIGQNTDPGHQWEGWWYCYKQTDGITVYLHKDGTWGQCVRAEDVYYETKHLCETVLAESEKPPPKILIDVEI